MQAGEVRPGDSAPAAGVKDLLPIPATDPGQADQHGQSSSTAPGEGPTLSHALATDVQADEGVVQRGNECVEKDVVDLGWNEKKENVATPLVRGMDNEHMWLLLRRFNKQIYHVQATQYPPPGGLDLNIADDEESSPDKLRANVERLYMTAGVGLLTAVKHFARLRSWREPRRTTYFAAAYFIAWAFDFLVPLLSAVLVALIAFPESRRILFPPAPLSLVDSTTGGVQKPKAGVLGSHDSATGALESHKGEAVEQEASNFVSSIASIALSSAAGKHPPGDPNSDEKAAFETAPDPAALAIRTADAKDEARGEKTGAKHDKTKAPMEAAMWGKMRPIMHTISDIADTWERFENALSPIPFFPSEVYRLRFVVILLPCVFGVSLFVTPYLFLKAVSFLCGFTFFSDPIISRGISWLNRTVPNWKKLLEPRNTILKGVPTNAQLTLTLLRHSEANHAPLPPPPHNTSPPPSTPPPLTEADMRATGSDAPLNATPSELNAAIIDTDTDTNNPPTISHTNPDPNTTIPAQPKPDSKPEPKPHSHHKATKLLTFFKSTTRSMVKTSLATDTVRAKALGNEPARNRLGVLPPRHDSDFDSDNNSNKTDNSGPTEFEARYEGDKGSVCLTTSTLGGANTVSFARASGAGSAMAAKITGKGVQEEDGKIMWRVPVSDIFELKKVGGYGWKARLVVGWAMDREVKDGLIFKTVGGDEYHITAVPLRDELFNRLLAVGGQKWEAR
ncbi:hypothetical protein N658DRAFT_449453 [Parathielavia hyrcaniae]|uniref:Uncharacterized protein n=1 Tax=Parathielavia hyrcaniae TaxID=113614 RepID=A0AAN6T205_9PEZI|nr:hypothetical protein N658DRAFT_449453 [Parathielavia hyrcaniae]